MAINIIDGLPGSGKTLYAVKMINEILKKKPETKILTNITELKLDHLELPAIEKLKEYLNSYIFIDEFSVFHDRLSPSEKRDLINHFREHRHLGQTIWLITQDMDVLPREVKALIDTRLRAVSQSLSMGGEFVYNEIIAGEQIGKKVLAGNKKELFKLYKSATVHVGVKRVVRNKILIFLGLLTIGILYGIYKWNTHDPTTSRLTGLKLDQKPKPQTHQVAQTETKKNKPEEEKTEEEYYRIKLSWIRKENGQVYYYDPRLRDWQKERLPWAKGIYVQYQPLSYFLIEKKSDVEKYRYQTEFPTENYKGAPSPVEGAGSAADPQKPRSKKEEDQEEKELKEREDRRWNNPIMRGPQ